MSLDIISKFFRKNFNTGFMILFVMSVINLLFMHYQFLFTIGLEADCFRSSPIDNLIACLLDTTIFFLLFWLLTFRKILPALALTFSFTLVWSFCNIFYARFFDQYLSWSAIGQAGNMTDATVTSSMLEGFRLIDIYYPIVIFIFCWIYRRCRNHDVKSRSLRTVVAIWLFSLVAGLLVHSTYCFHPTMTFTYQLNKTIFTPPLYDSMWPNWTMFHKGTFRKMILEQLLFSSKLELTEEQEQEIERAYTDYSQRTTGRTASDSIRNIVFILVESYLASPTDLVVDGQEITPNLNRLKHDSTTYYNGHVRPNVSIGRSSDGQFIYMSGLLPLNSEITVSKAKNDTIIGLPEQMKTLFPDLHSFTIIPSNPTLWEQQPMSAAYGFDRLYSAQDYQRDNHVDAGNYLNDEMIFDYAEQKDVQDNEPFFSLVLTVSMHLPYDHAIEHGFVITDPNLSERYTNYLNNCHYTDIQIGKYLESLKRKGLYDHSLIVIAADHEPPLQYIDMDGKVTDDLPLFIVHGGFDPGQAWDGECNQIDVYTTILDIMGVEGQWRGLGHTLLNKNYSNSVSEDTKRLSEWIIRGNYLRKLFLPSAE